MSSSDSDILKQLDEKLSTCNGIDVREITIAQLQQFFATGKLSSKELTECYLNRIREINPYLKCVIEVNPDAVPIAVKLDDERKKGAMRGPLHGIPVLVKDNFATADKMETTAGCVALIGLKPKKDAEVVRRLREEGVVILGKANLGEMSFFRGSNIPNGWSGRGGQTRSAYNLEANPQGSSSGSAVSTSANLAVVAIGTETDGSLISPSSVAGCVSMKPTHNLISVEGVIPISHNQDTVGPITRTVMDAAFLLDGMVPKPNPNFQSSGGSYASSLLQKSTTPLKIGIPRRPFWTPELAKSWLLEQDLEELNKLLEKFKGHPTVTLVDHLNQDWDSIKDISEREVTVLLHDFKHDMNCYLKNDVVPTTRPTASDTCVQNLQDLIDFNKKNPCEHGYNQHYLEQAQDTDGLQSPDYVTALESNRTSARKYLDDLLDGNGLDAICVPSEPRDKPRVDPALGNCPFVAWTVAAVAGYPSITVPAGIDQYGVPYGVCFIGRPNSEVILLKTAQVVETICPARKLPTFINKLE